MNTNLLLSQKHAASAQHSHAHIHLLSVIKGFLKCITVLLHELLIRSKLWWAWWLTSVNTDIHALKHTWNHTTHIKTRSYVSGEDERSLLTGVAGSAEGCWGRKLRKNSAEKDYYWSDMSSIRVHRDCACAHTVYKDGRRRSPARGP